MHHLHKFVIGLLYISFFTISTSSHAEILEFTVADQFYAITGGGSYNTLNDEVIEYDLTVVSDGMPFRFEKSPSVTEIMVSTTPPNTIRSGFTVALDEFNPMTTNSGIEGTFYFFAELEYFLNGDPLEERLASFELQTVSFVATTVPEPSTYAMMALGLLGLAGMSRRKIKLNR